MKKFFKRLLWFVFLLNYTERCSDDCENKKYKKVCVIILLSFYYLIINISKEIQ